MSLFQTYQKLMYVIPILGFIMGKSNCEIMKNKMCVQFEFNNYFSNGTTIIDSIAGTTKKQCFLSCVRNNPCSAFHFQPIDGSCELLETPEKCMSHDVTTGTVFVQLTKCDGRPLWKIVSPALDKLQWKGQYNTGDHKAVRTKNGERGILRALYQGMYITGFFLTTGNTAYIVDMDGKRFHCSHLYQILTYTDPADLSWVDYDAGAPILLSAVVGGYSQNGAPLYVVSLSPPRKSGDWKPGYYNAFTKEVRVAKARGTNRPFRLLVENWFG